MISQQVQFGFNVNANKKHSLYMETVFFICTLSYYFSLCNTSFYLYVVHQIMWGKEIFPGKLSKYRRYLSTFFLKEKSSIAFIHKFISIII
ncbi:hypothetical protein DJ93_3178 [Bacillus clarus]|uniref:Uncharacterized protein n=1 Tax=Bacillus clarus TaxID=2338372 RepID=A0A090YQP3_9BACI|nr:hypothetical protein DJ93_3178 [Bacillus clarus]